MKKETLGLYGPEDSKYLRLVERWAAEIGVKTAWVAGPTPGCAAYVADTEAGWPMWDLPHEEDVDCICHDGLSCAAYAALCLLSWYGAGRGVRKVCVLGRGHAVQGLRGALERMGCQVTQCAGRELLRTVGFGDADAVICGVPHLERLAGRPKVVVDMSGALEALDGRADAYVGREMVGRENVRELLRRAKAALKKKTVLTALRCLEAFEKDHNLEHLVDAANYLMFRFSFPLPGDYFRATDSDGSVGTVGTPINMEKGG